MGLASFFFLLFAVCSPGLAPARETGPRDAWGTSSVDRRSAISIAELPPEGQDTYARIGRGGPFRFEKDGVVFGNRERLLPVHARGYYREYTVATPGARDRGIRRIVCGGATRTPDVCYYSDDHYSSFRRIAP